MCSDSDWVVLGRTHEKLTMKNTKDVILGANHVIMDELQ